MAREVVETGEVHVWRGDRDADLLLAIRGGAWTYDALMEWTERTEAAIDAALKCSPLPKRVDRDALNALTASLVREALGV